MTRTATLLLLLATFSAQAQQYHLPFNGRWFVMQGGDTLNVDQHMSVRAQWFGLDFAKVGGLSQRELSRTASPSRAEDFYSWGEPVLAPADGDVASVIDALPDNPLGVKDTGHPTGNRVVITVAPTRFVILAHFQRGTISVKAGQRVRRGEVLGKCGNSGNSDFPHVHMHVQDSAELNAGNGQNATFASINVELTGRPFENVTWPLIRGLFVANH
jgi:hypothetical protein